MEASGAGVVGQLAGGSRAAEVESRGTGQGGVVRQAGGVSRSDPARGVEIHEDGTGGAAATNNNAGIRREAGQRGHHDGIIEGPDAALNAQQAVLAGHLPADNGDHVERLLQRRLAAERELKVVGGPLILSASTFLMSPIVKAHNHPPAWVTKDLKSGEEYYRAIFYDMCNILAFANALSTVIVLGLYHFKDHLEVPAPAERVLTAVRVTMPLTIMLMAMSCSVGVSEDWRGATTMFLAMVVTAAVAFLSRGKLKQSVVKMLKFFISSKIGELVGF